MGEPWTICHGCMKPIAVTITPRTESEGAGWWYSCPPPCYSHDDDTQQREREAGSGPADWDRDIAPPTALDNLARILPILARIADDESVPATIRSDAGGMVSAVKARLAARKAVKP